MHLRQILFVAVLSVTVSSSVIRTSPKHISDTQLVLSDVAGHLAARQLQDNNHCGKLKDGGIKSCNPDSHGGGPCCSEHNWCGNGPLYCGTGCQPAFGKCGDLSASSSAISVSTASLTMPTSQAFSASFSTTASSTTTSTTSAASSSTGSSSASSIAASNSKSAASSTTSRTSPIAARGCVVPTQKPGPDGPRCGPEHNNLCCPSDLCCSQAGYCGNDERYCSVPGNCQRYFGRCDSSVRAHGFTTEGQQREFAGRLPYGEIITKCKKPKTLALSFDDGPTNYTWALLDMLRDHQAKATFFVSGVTQGRGGLDTTPERVDAVRRMIVDGHQVASHTWSHPHLNYIDQPEAKARELRKDEMYVNERAIANIIGKFPTYMRPPYLECDDDCMADMKDLGYHVLHWEVDSGDWRKGATLEEQKHAIDTAFSQHGNEDNMFVIQHDSKPEAVDVAHYILEKAQQKGWSAVPLGECMADNPDDWYRVPVWTRAGSVATGGCVVSDTNFCGQIAPFSNRPGCEDAHARCKGTVSTCKHDLSEKADACAEYERICRRLRTFCDDCKDGPCDIKQWNFNRSPKASK